MIATLISACLLAKQPTPTPSVLATFTDGTFSTSNWTYATYCTAPSLMSIVIQQVASGGNPGAYVQTVVTDSGIGMRTTYRSFGSALNSNATWDPSTQGAIGSLDLSMDGLHPDTSQDPKVFMMLKQGTKYYIDPGYVWISPSFVWISGALSQTGVTASTFIEIDVSGGSLAWNLSSHPDFSATGGPITFGIARWCQHLFSTGASDLGEEDVDNWSVTLNS